MAAQRREVGLSVGDLKLACYIGPWGNDGLIQAIQDIAGSGFDGIECPASIVTEYEDRLHVFEEILSHSRLRLAGLLQKMDLLDREHADEQVERAANSARFLGAGGEGCLTIYHGETRETPLTEEDWSTLGAMIEEIGTRCAEFGVTLCYLPRAMRLVGSENEIKRLLLMTNPDCVKLAVDTAETVLAGATPERLFKQFADRLRHVRYRDVSGSKRRSRATSAKPGSTPQFGRGAINFESVSKALLTCGYNQWITLDVSGEAAAPREAATTGLRFLMRKSGLFPAYDF